MTYRQTLDFLFEQLPMYQRIGAAAYKKDLTNIIALCEALDNPQLSFKTIHIAGTNGKGSTSHMLASIFQENNLKTGLYTSPHLIDFRERIRINGVPVHEEFVIDFVKRIRPELDKIKPSFFEITVAMAFSWFRDQKVDVAVIETGLGGRLDSTNIINPELSIITNIGFDHMDMLGDTLDKIAFEKAGIIKAKTPVVIGEYQPEIQFVFDEKAKIEESEIIVAEHTIMTMEFLECDLKGIYQQKNMITVRAAINVLAQYGWEISPEAVRRGFASVVKNTGLMGRWQTIREQPKVICDTGHNAEGIAEIVKQLATESFNQLHIVFGQVAGKDPIRVLSLLPKSANYYFCAPSIPRALNVDSLEEFAHSVGLNGNSFASVDLAYQAALKQANEDDLIFVGGSTFVVADLIGIYGI